jgi:predicted esterase
VRCSRNAIGPKVIERTVSASTHGRYLVEPSSTGGDQPLLVGFHGYGERAEPHLERLRAIPGSDGWVLLSIQGLHQFYRGQSSSVVASWMTRQDRELAIADNTAYVTMVVTEVAREWHVRPTVVYAGFSQGVAMAYRAACASPLPVGGVIALGADVPPELDRASLARLGAVLHGRGERDELYSAAVADADVSRLRDARVEVQSILLDAAHEWTADFSMHAGEFLRRWR